MAYDKIIDSTQLDGAMTATANAIRAKSGGAAKIAWDESTGFANAITAISSGGKVAVGSILPGTATTVTVSGLGFKPTKVIVFWNDIADDSAAQNGYFENRALYALYGLQDSVYDPDGTHSFVVQNEYYDNTYEDGETYEDIFLNGKFYRDYLTITPTSDGFTLTRGVGKMNASDKYSYIAIG